jgi:hypothetical protein
LRERGAREEHTDVEEEVECDTTLTDGEVLVAFGHMGPSSGKTTVTGEHGCGAESTPDKGLTTGHLVGESDATPSTEGRCERIAEIEDELMVLVVAERGVDLGVEVSR